MKKINYEIYIIFKIQTIKSSIIYDTVSSGLKNTN